MSNRNPVERIESPAYPDVPYQNVEGWERVGSLAGGVVMLGKGIRRGGFIGLIQVGIGAMALKRGITGHSSTKRLLEKSRQQLHSVRSDIERAGDELLRMKDEVERKIVKSV